MKKTALTIGLFSLVVVATSFANPTTSTLSSEKSSIVPPVDGKGATGGTRKHDELMSNQESLAKNNQASFNGINQSLGANKKLD
ncbi:hypothetical protein LPB248_12275 [Flavobacterium sp. LPB0248]|uniref:hypothetical protein n=1 Tax=Flavobacterium sp. LPB0248 TaxID=2614441 RepID=UPI0015A6A24F|nr:hypothetical protein [Flavobacterium sp. LPB0248]QLC67044.1 hypothetical protein LPB248_12275 [Flavobacterium sp. LPB0248]